MTTKALLLGIFFCLTFLSASAELKPATQAAYDNYIAKLEDGLNQQNHSASNFLWIDQKPDRLKAVRGGKIWTEHKKVGTIPDGMIEHWIAGSFAPGATLEQVIRIDQNYSNYSKIYKPEITRPRVISHDGNHYLVSYRITKKKVITAVVDTVHAIDYLPLGPDRMGIQSRSTSVNQVESAGTSSERILPQGEGLGFLWAINSYWRMEERDGGVYVECEAITLTRNVPLGLGAIINPILQSFAEESLEKTLQDKRLAVTSVQ